MARPQYTPEEKKAYHAKKAVTAAGFTWEEFAEAKRIVDICAESLADRKAGNNSREFVREQYAIWLLMTDEQKEETGMVKQMDFAAFYNVSARVLRKWKNDPEYRRVYLKHDGVRGLVLDKLGDIIDAHIKIVTGKKPDVKPNAAMFRELYELAGVKNEEGDAAADEAEARGISMGASAMSMLFYRDIVDGAAMQRFFDWLLDPSADRMPTMEEVRPRFEEAVQDALQGLFSRNKRRQKAPDETTRAEQAAKDTGRPMLKPRFFEEEKDRPVDPSQAFLG